MQTDYPQDMVQAATGRSQTCYSRAEEADLRLRGYERVHGEVEFQEFPMLVSSASSTEGVGHEVASVLVSSTATGGRSVPHEQRPGGKSLLSEGNRAIYAHFEVYRP